MMTSAFGGLIKNGKLVLDQPEYFRKHVASLEGKRIQLSLGRLRQNRSNDANRYYWGVVLKVFGNETGYRAEELHEALKLKFLPVDPDALLVIAKSTTSLDTREFAEYVDRVIQLAAEMEIVIPSSDEVAA